MLCVLSTAHKLFCLLLMGSSSTCDLCWWKQTLVTSVARRRQRAASWAGLHRDFTEWCCLSQRHLLDLWSSVFTPQAVGIAHSNPCRTSCPWLVSELIFKPCWFEVQLAWRFDVQLLRIKAEHRRGQHVQLVWNPLYTPHCQSNGERSD